MSEYVTFNVRGMYTNTHALEMRRTQRHPMSTFILMTRRNLNNNLAFFRRFGADIVFL